MSRTSVVNGMAIILRDVTETRHRAAGTVESEKLSANHAACQARAIARRDWQSIELLNSSFCNSWSARIEKIADVPGQEQAAAGGFCIVARDEIARLDQIINQFTPGDSTNTAGELPN